jgi:endonuclease/exonuclease/phosphatase family metal-dependent hydrolase
MTRIHVIAFLLALSAPQASAGDEWDPANASWGKTDPTDLRVMTWNVQDGLCSSADKTETFNSWTALARIVAAMRPDVLILQETADNTGNGTGSGVDTSGELAATLFLFFNGGADPFNGGNVTAYVRAYAPDYDLPYIYASTATDNFNRNAIMSRYPFGDLNGDGVAIRADMPTLLSDQYATGPNGGIRGFTHAEIDLPDGTYQGDLVVGCSHLKSGGGASDHSDRIDAAQNIAYFVDYFYFGAGTGTPDPNGKLFDNPPAQSVLGPADAVIVGGDWNEDEQNNGATVGPAQWIRCAQFCEPGVDGPDRDRTDLVYDDAREFFTNARQTLGSNKLDYQAWSDSSVSLRRSFIFRSNATPLASLPPEVAGFPSNPLVASTVAADHLPVICDYILPAAPVGPPGTPFCFGTSGCPCGNNDPFGGCANSNGFGAQLAASGTTSVSSDDLLLIASGFPPNNTGLYFMGAATFAPVVVGDGLACTGGLFRFFPSAVSPSGEFTLASPVAGAPAGMINAGDTRHFQAWTRDVLCGPPPAPCPSPCGMNSNLSNGYSVVFTP